MLRKILFATLLAAGSAEAQHVPPGPAGAPPPGPQGALSPEALATVPDLNAAQQVEVRKILLQRRDAHDTLRAKELAEREAQRARSRAEHERIDDESSARLRKLLGDDGYRNLAQWLLPRGRDIGPGRPHLPGGPRGPGLPEPPAVGVVDPPVAAPADVEEQAHVR